MKHTMIAANDMPLVGIVRGYQPSERTTTWKYHPPCANCGSYNAERTIAGVPRNWDELRHGSEASKDRIAPILATVRCLNPANCEKRRRARLAEAFQTYGIKHHGLDSMLLPGYAVEELLALIEEIALIAGDLTPDIRRRITAAMKLRRETR